jgi:diazepam-binding inhibitor (GABA receptor modulating acyl-CoA-binding protein)
MSYKESEILQFRRACREVKELNSRPSDDEMLQLYGLYKQATIGNNATSQPWLIDVRGRAKWKAWTACLGKDQDDARGEYVTLVHGLKAKLGVT